MRIEMSDVLSSENDEVRIVRAVLLLTRRLRRSVPDGHPTGSSLALLASLHRHGPMDAVTLARSEGLKPQSLTRLLVRLEDEGLIERPTDPEDRRRQRIGVTPTGAAALGQAMLQRREWLADAIARRDRKSVV